MIMLGIAFPMLAGLAHSKAGKLETLLGDRNSESFKGPNDHKFDRDGRWYFTDQGQTDSRAGRYGDCGPDHRAPKAGDRTSLNPGRSDAVADSRFFLSHHQRRR